MAFELIPYPVARDLVEAARQRGMDLGKMPLDALRAVIEQEIDDRMSSARVWTARGFNVTGDEWTRRMAALEQISRLILFVQNHERAIAKAVKEAGK